MWRHPRYAELTGRPSPETPTAPPEPTGETLATLVRRGPDGLEQRLRIALDSFQGHEYVSVRLWEAGRPTKKGCSLRMAELPMIVAALQEAMGRAARTPSPEPTTREAPRRRQRPGGRRRWDDAGTPPAPRPGFDEFDEFS